MELLHIDTFQIAKRFAQAGQSYNEHGVIQQQIAHRLMQLIAEYDADESNVQNPDQNNDQKRIFEIGCGSGNLTKLLIKNKSYETLYLNDLYPEVKKHFDADQFENEQANAREMKDQKVKAHDSIEWCIGDAEVIEFPQELNLIISSSALQWMRDLEGLFRKSNQALLNHGLLCFSTFGENNLREIKALTQKGLVYCNLDDIQQKLEQQGFEVLYISEQVSVLNFKHPKHVLQHLKATGVTATAAKFRWTKQSLQKFYHGYRQFISTDEHENLVYPLSYHPIYVIARKHAQ